MCSLPVRPWSLSTMRSRLTQSSIALRSVLSHTLALSHLSEGDGLVSPFEGYPRGRWIRSLGPRPTCPEVVGWNGYYQWPVMEMCTHIVIGA